MSVRNLINVLFYHSCQSHLLPFCWREKGSYGSVSELETIIKSKFINTAICLGNPALKGRRSTVKVSVWLMRRRGVVTISHVQISQPFPRFLSRGCPGFYRLVPGVPDMTGGMCSSCSQEIPITTPPSQAGRRGGLEPRTRQMSDTTRNKIAESIKTFSICKLCSKQCRGFRGLVDHMHRDHENYKPWKCHVCPERTAFVKTLYRHLKNEHGLSGGPCSVCGKIFRRAQSMLHHVNKVIISRLLLIKSEK